MEDRSEGVASAAGRGVWGLDRGHFAMTRLGDPRLDEAGPFPLSLSTRLLGQPPPHYWLPFGVSAPTSKVLKTFLYFPRLKGQCWLE